MKEYEASRIHCQGRGLHPPAARQNTAQAKAVGGAWNACKEGLIPLPQHRMVFGFKGNRRSGDIILRTKGCRSVSKMNGLAFRMPDVELRRGSVWA